MKTVFHSYRFDLRNADEREAWEALKAKLTAEGLKVFETWGGKGSYCIPELDGKTIELETAHLFNNQWNTAPIDGHSEKGLRVFDWAKDYPIDFSKSIARGHWLEQTAEMREARRNTVGCGYCGKQEPAAKGYVFCPHCIGSEYLKASELHLTRMVAVDDDGERAPLTEAESAHLMPLYKEAQLHGHTERDKARHTKQRRDIETKFRNATENAKAEHDGFLWLLDRGFKIDNVVYYSHTGKFCFGWRKPLEADIKSALLDVLSEFPFDYEFKER